MFNVAAYNLIDRNLIISNPCRFYCELKYETVDEVFDNLKRSMNLTGDEYEVMYEDVMRMAAKSPGNWTDLVRNSKELNVDNYLTKLDICLRTLSKSKYIESNYRTRFNSNKDILDLKIVELCILDKGKKALEAIDIMKTTDVDSILRMSVVALSEFVRNIDILDFDRYRLIDEFNQICENISEINIIDFSHDTNRGVIFDHYKCRFEVDDIKKFTKFINDNNNFELERIIKSFLQRSVIDMYDTKVIINALKSNHFESIYSFMREDAILRHLSYLAEGDYIRLDYSYVDIDHNNFPRNLRLHSYFITEKAYEYLDDNSFIDMKQSELMAPDIVRELKIGVKRKDYIDYFQRTTYMKGFIHFL